MFSNPLFQALSCGKPISISADTIDCEFPDDIEAIKVPDGSTLPSSETLVTIVLFPISYVCQTDWRLFHVFTKDILVTLTDRVCAAKPPKYTEILEMDRKLTEHESHSGNILDICVGMISNNRLSTLDRQTQMKLGSRNLQGSLGKSALTYTCVLRRILTDR